MDLVTRIERTQHLGGEFLTWLWFQSELNEGRVLAGDQEVEVWFDARLTLESLGQVRESNVIRSDSPTETDEARASLQSGKHVQQARLRVVLDQKSWTATIKAEDLTLHSVKVPALLTEAEDDRLYERLALLEEIHALVGGLFGSFMEIRLDHGRWHDEVKHLRHWVHGSKPS